MAKARDSVLDKLSIRQKEVFLDIEEYDPIVSILHGSVRSGKTFLADQILWLKHIAKFRGRGINFIMTGFTIPSLRKNVLDDLEASYGIDTKLDANNSFELFGNRILCFGTNNANSYKAMRGMTAYGWYGNEITLSHMNSVNEGLARCSGDGFRIFWETNPDNPNHNVKLNYINRSGERLSSGRMHIKAYHFQIEDNLIKNGGGLSEEYVESLKKNTPEGVATDRAVKGLWVAREGIVYDCFIESQMTCEHPPMNEISEFFSGVDWGFKHPGVICLFGIRKEKVILLDIIKETEKDIDWWVTEKKRIQAKHLCTQFYCDSARPEYVLKFNGINADKSVIEGIDKMYSMLKKGELLISERCIKLFTEELYQYRWRETGVKEEPIKLWDDIMDACRYALYTKFGKTEVIKEITADTRI